MIPIFFFFGDYFSSHAFVAHMNMYLRSFVAHTVLSHYEYIHTFLIFDSYCRY
jgi:hypothetical protein